MASYTAVQVKLKEKSSKSNPIQRNPLNSNVTEATRIWSSHTYLLYAETKVEYAVWSVALTVGPTHLSDELRQSLAQICCTQRNETAFQPRWSHWTHARRQNMLLRSTENERQFNYKFKIEEECRTSHAPQATCNSILPPVHPLALGKHFAKRNTNMGQGSIFISHLITNKSHELLNIIKISRLITKDDTAHAYSSSLMFIYILS